MSTPRPIHTAARRDAISSRLSDYLELAKPRIVVMELVVAAAAAFVAAPRTIDFSVLLLALFGTSLVAASASAANHWAERRSDLLMKRTRNRPVAAGRVSTFEALGLSALGLLLGMAVLMLGVNTTTAVLGLASWLLYVVVYTPMKTITPMNTVVGAVAGAMPALMGWAATGKPFGVLAWSLAAVLFLWQFPHFMAIAWLYRDDYAAGGHKMLTVVDRRGLRAGLQAVLCALVLIPVSMLPALPPTSGSPWVLATWSVLLGTVQLVLAARFAYYRTDSAARRLLHATLIYLPAWLGVLVMVSI